MGNIFGGNRNCVFCEIVSDIGRDEGTDIDKVLSYNDELAILSDLHPASKHHYLVIPRHHVSNPKELKGTEHIALVEKMYEFGKEYLYSVESEEIINDSLYGFHFPPFISVDHLHMHVICPSSSMNFTNSNLFRKDTWYFVSPERIIERLKQGI